MCFSSPKVPSPPPAAPPPVKQDIVNDEAVKQAKSDERKKQLRAAGLQSTVLTGALGSAPTTRKTLLGQ